MAAGIEGTGIVPSAVEGSDSRSSSGPKDKFEEIRKMFQQKGYQTLALQNDGYGRKITISDLSNRELSYSVSFSAVSQTLYVKREEYFHKDFYWVSDYLVALVIAFSGFALCFLIPSAALGTISGLWILLPVALALIAGIKLYLSSRKHSQQEEQELERMISMFQELALQCDSSLEVELKLDRSEGRRTRSLCYDKKYRLACGKGMNEALAPHLLPPLLSLAGDYFFPE